ncbi:flavin reductase family protein [Streptomyces sp. NBC_00344]|uniref:flavin reductase family protein n=1 Tax=Streptomyces sp. NBC_00344 TaxID=2975720 RepID=UPI002E1E26E8
MSTAVASNTVDPADLKGVHRTFVTGVTVVTTQHEGTPRGLAVNAFSSISLDPPLVMVCVQKTSSTYESLFASRHLAINILAADQLGVAGTFAGKSQDKFSEIRWHPGTHGSPVVDGACAHVEAEICERLQTDTHTVFIARVLEAEHSDRAPLVYSAGSFYDGGRLAPAETA